ncbi:TATA binding protein of transcription factor TFIID [Haladaptatus litoreus]|uniref:TATA-box-binding protein n=1 Tax=Haladaptatus litoreus TaxID=553468 RepID=A0A1N7DCF1_9EURY|nr:TATA-box-binding protein [Haladaptatus litoreus]SIR73530.1 TATA binding protein of transcription factor TFIID [Haladaptatus litoreus]
MTAQSASTSTTIENIVASTQIKQELDVKQLGADLEGGIYDHEQFPGVIFRSPTTQATMLLYRSGKIISTGANCIEDVEEGYRILFSHLRTLGIAVTAQPSITIQNLVSSADLRISLDLNALAIGLGIEEIEYEPEQFPGLVYRPDGISIVILVFNNGKLIITGAKTESETQIGVERVKSRLTELGFSDY